MGALAPARTDRSVSLSLGSRSSVNVCPSRGFADALLENEPDTATLARLYGQIGRMRLVSSAAVVREANNLAHKILDAYAADNRSKTEVRDFLARDSIDLFSDFGDACRAELLRLEPHGMVLEGPLGWKLTPIADAPPAQ